MIFRVIERRATDTFRDLSNVWGLVSSGTESKLRKTPNRMNLLNYVFFFNIDYIVSNLSIS